MANRTLVWFLFAVAVAVGLIVAFGQAPTPPPSGGVFPISNGKLLSPLDANQFKIINGPVPTSQSDYATKDYVDTHAGGGGGGGGGSGLNSITGDDGTATGLTLAITSPSNVLTDPVFTLGATLNLANGGTGATTAAGARTGIGLGHVDDTSDAAKPVSTPTQTALNAKADTSAVNTALSSKADTSAVNTALAGKEPLLPITANDGYVLSRHDAANGGTWYFAAPGSSPSGSPPVAGVTSVTVNGTASPTPIPNNLLQTQVTNNTTSADIVLTTPVVGANTFYGNGTAFTSTPGFMIASAARTALGGTTAGQALFQLTNPNAIAFPRLNADNSASVRTAAQMLSDIGAAPAFTASAPLTLGVGGSPLSISQAGTAANGYLSSTDWNTFNAKVPASRTLTTTAPLRINNISGAPGADFSANRTIDETAASSSTDGYLKATDFATFANGGVVSTTVGGGTATLSTGYNRVVTILVSNLTATLPPAAGYLGGKYIEFVDLAGGSVNYSVTIKASPGELINGQAQIILPRGWLYLRINSDGASKWNTVEYYATTVKDPNDATKQFNFSAALQQGSPAPSPGLVTAAPGTSVTVKPTTDAVSDLAPPNEVLRAIKQNGVPISNRLTPAELQIREDVIGTPGINLPSSGSHQIPSDGSIDTVRIAGTLNGTYTLVWPPASAYPANAANGTGSIPITLIDSSGSVNATNILIIGSLSGDSFNDGASTIVEERFVNKPFRSNGSDTWTFPVVKTSVQAFKDQVGPELVIDGLLSAVKHNLHATLASGSNNITVTNRYNGMSLDLVLKQPASGAAGTLNLPSKSIVGAGGGGVVTLSTASNKIDHLRGIYDGIEGAFVWDPPVLDHTATNLPAAPASPSATPINSTTIRVSWTDNSTTETGFEIQRAPGVSGTSFAQVATVAGSSPASTTGGTFTYDDSNLASGTGYSYRIRSFNSAGNSASFTSSVSATTPSGAPSGNLLEWHLNDGATGPTTTVASSSAGPAGTQQKAADWTTATRSGTGAAMSATVGMSTTPGQSVTPTGGTAAGQTWKYRILAFKSATGLHNGVTDATTTVGYATLSPSQFNRIQWSAVTGADYYEIYRTTVASGSGLITGHLIGSHTTGAGPFTFDDTGIATDGPAVTGSSTDISKITANSTVNYNTNVVSMSFWGNANGGTFNPSPDAGDPIVNLGIGSNNQKFILQTGSKFQVTMSAVSPGTGSIIATCSNSSIQTGWHHIVVILDNSTAGNTPSVTGTPTPTASDNVRVYYDKVQQTLTYTTVSRGTGPFIFPTDTPFVGQGPGFNGLYDDVRLFSPAVGTGPHGELSQAQIDALYNDGPQ